MLRRPRSSNHRRLSRALPPPRRRQKVNEIQRKREKKAHSFFPSLSLSLDSSSKRRSKIYTGFPQPPSPSLGIDNLGGFGDVKVR